MTPPSAVIQAQTRASDPGASAWVSANAGAGKTTVLSRRVVRLLLSGVAPRSILCLTFTTAAAAEMAQRVHTTLAQLATLPDESLLREVAGLAPDADPTIAAARARTLFAETLETPGGLKVQTTHAFASQLLRRFPLEANVSGSFQVLDDATRAEITERALVTVLARGADDPDGSVARALAALAPHVSDVGLAGAIQAVVAERRRLIDWIGHGADFDTPGALDLDPATVAQDLQSALALDHTSPEDCAPVLGLAACQAIIEAARALGQSVAVADRMAAALEASGEDAERLWHQLLFTTAGEPKKADKLVARKVAAAVPDFPALVEAEQARLMRRAERDRAEQAIAATVPLLVLSWQVLSELEAEKRRRGVIDYDDQIAKAHSLVQSASAAAWVRFKLDEGIDHVMVDEAQDTSPAQWDLVDALVDEFFAGAGARGTTRTLFVVGDEKQSIYSFQGAAPRLFADKRAHYGGRAEASGAAFHAVELAHSFRSAPQVLSAVDRVFAAPELARSVGAEVGAVHHEQIKEIPGGVDIWPLFADTPAEESDAWDAPFDRTPDDAGHVKLVKAIADQIAQWMTGDGPDGGPPVTPGDILILSRKREPFATLMNRELKRRGIPAAGADRLDVTAQIAVRDMVALARALITRDDLSLASVLRSPLFGFTDEALFAVAYGRDGSLLAALQTGDAQARNAHATLSRWRAMARTMRPFDFLAAILLGEGRRADFAARMGSEAEDALDAFLDMALGFEARGIPALETFLHRLERTNEVLRRSADSGANTVRVMTVHGAKGLEARVVFLADVGSTIGGGRAPTVLPIPHDGETWTADLLLYCPTREHKPAPARHVTEQRAAAEAAEHHRLLYVGMTRAEQTLVVCGSYGKRAPQRGMWHALVREALAPECREVPMPGHEEPALLWRTPEPAPHPPRAAPSAEVPAEAAPDWLITPAHLPRRTSEPIVPSDAEGTHETGPATTAAPRALDAARHGALVHDLLENAGDPAAMADRVRRAAPDLAARDAEAIVAEVAAVLALPELSAQTVRREVDLIGDVRMDGVLRRAAGRIDRLQLDPAGATVVDYKTDRSVPESPRDTPEPYRRQLAIYRALVETALPGVAVKTAIVWTAAPRWMSMDRALPRISPA